MTTEIDRILCPIGGIGDHVSMLPAIAEYAKTRPVAVRSHPVVQPLLPPAWNYVTAPGEPEPPLFVMPIERILTKFGTAGPSVVRLAYDLLDLPIPDEETPPPIAWERRAPCVDVVFCPFSSAPQRALDPFAAHRILNEIRREISRDVLVVGTAHDRRMFPVECDFAVDQPLRWVAGAIANATVVVTVDSMCNRIAHGVEARNHVLLSDTVVGAEWAGWKATARAPGAYQLHGRELWRPRIIVDAIRAAMARTGSAFVLAARR